MTDKRLAIESQAIHAGEIHDPSGAHIAPIHQTSTFTFKDMDTVVRWGAGEVEGDIYTRVGNPTRRALATKLAALESIGLDDASDVGAEIFGSGMAAIAASLMGLAKAGDHIVTQQVLYGSTDHLISDVLPEFGVTTSRVAALEPDRLEEELVAHPQTTVVYLETPANPTMRIVDIATTVAIAKERGARVVVDNTFATPVLQRPLTLGADVVVHSTTKYINGHGTVIGGAAVYRNAAELDDRIARLIKFTGGVPSPMDCWLTNLGLKTLPLRMERHNANATEVAAFLAQHDKIAATHYPGLAENPGHSVAAKQMLGFGAMIAFDLGSFEAAAAFLDGLELCALAVSLGNIDTLVEHPASMTHRVVPPEQRQAAGITDGLVRMSVGLEAVGDIIDDVAQALEA
ncbi:MAG: PLP-dependent transferase [Acidimicrobiia bacterium]|nr:PLP-dependent transferase [Acidimicrobiia bacterium]